MRYRREVAGFAFVGAGVGLVTGVPGFDVRLAPALYGSLHLLLELVSVVVAALVAATGWHTLHRHPNRQLAVVVCAYAGVAVLDLAHALLFEGMPAFFGPTGAGRAIAPYLAARLLAATAMAAVVWMPPGTQISRRGRWLLLGGTAGFALSLAAADQVWPGLRLLLLQPGVGPTALKEALEVVIVLLYLAAAWGLWRRLLLAPSRSLRLLLAAAVLMALSELSVALYRHPTDLANLLGHVLKVAAYVLVYRAVFVRMVLEPWASLDRARQALAAGEARWRMLFANSLDAVLVTTPEGRVIAANPAACRLFGRSEQELREGGRAMVVDPDDHVRQRELLERRGREGRVTGELRFRRADGSVFEAELTSALYQDDEGAWHASLLVRDVTERKRRDRETLRLAQLEAANAELERFSYALAHDLRAPLASVAGFAGALDAAVQARRTERLPHFVGRIQANAQRMEGMVEGLLALAKLSRDALQPEAVDLSALARELLAQLRERHPERAVEVLVHDGLRAQADPRLAGLLLQNLLENAWKFTAGVAAARIEVGGDHAPDGQPVYWVADNGVGFDMADAGRLFDPFQRLHADATFPGHGIGLANVKRVVERHGGRVWADARPGGGAVFRFTLGVPVGA